MVSMVDEKSSQSTDGESGEEQTVSAFLSFIEKDACVNPSNLSAVSAEQMARIEVITDGVLCTDDDDLG